MPSLRIGIDVLSRTVGPFELALIQPENGAEAVPDAVDATLPFLRPRGVAVIGVSHSENSLGTRLFRNIVSGGFPGPVYAINKDGGTVGSTSLYRSILECPEPVDLALIIVPVAAATGVAEECGRKGVKGIVVITAGFAETGSDGAARQKELTAVCRKYGMRLMGPNCSGFVSADPEFNLNAQFTPYKPLTGRVGFFSQSGALGAAVFEYANRLGLGLSAFISVGNEADVSAIDFLRYWQDDPKTDLILLYLESLGNPRRFLKLTREITKKKPILVVKGGRSTTGLRAAHSHTGALVEGSGSLIDTLFAQAGIIRADTLEEMLDLAALLVNQPVPKGNRVGIVTNAGGAGILAADACEEFGLEVPEYSAVTQAELRNFLRPEASVKNPVDMLASSTVSDSAQAARVVARDTGIDGMIVLSAPPLFFTLDELAKQILAIVRDTHPHIPVVLSFLGTFGVSKILTDGSVCIPSYPVPRMAAQTLSRAVSYGRWLRRSPGSVPAFPETNRVESQGLVNRAIDAGRSWLSQEEVAQLLDCYGIAMVKTQRASSPEEAGRAALTLGGKVVLKAEAEGVIHKSDAGAVKVGLVGESEVRDAAREMARRLTAAGHTPTAFLVQPMVPSGPEMIVGVTNDPRFGPVVLCGAGGVVVELLKDISVRIAPLTDVDAEEMITSLKTYQALTGYRGGPATDVPALRDIVLRAAALAQDLPEIAELDLNPLIMQRPGKGAVVVDARARVERRGAQQV